MSFEEFKEMYPVQNGSNMVQNCTESISQEAKMCDCHETEKQVCDECQKAKDAADTLDLVPQYADQPTTRSCTRRQSSLSVRHLHRDPHVLHFAR